MLERTMQQQQMHRPSDCHTARTNTTTPPSLSTLTPHRTPYNTIRATTNHDKQRVSQTGLLTEE